MKSIKNLLLIVVLFAGFALVNLTLSGYRSNDYASMRVRTVPASTEQKKKEPAPEVNPTPQSKSATNQEEGFFCNDTGTLKAKLAVTNGGAPK